MEAIILNSGIGKRMGALTEQRPKCLLEIGCGQTILSRQIDILDKCGIGKFIITTGHCDDNIKDYVICNYPNIKVEYVYNDCYTSTNYIYSLLLTQYLVDGDVLLLHGDMVFEELTIARLIEDNNKNAVLVKKNAELPQKDFKGKLESDRVQEISIHLFEKHCHFLLPVYKLSQELYSLWIKEIKDFFSRGELNVYAEDALNRILPQVILKPINVDNLFCAEVDNLEDLNLVRNWVMNQNKYI